MLVVPKFRAFHNGEMTDIFKINFSTNEIVYANELGIYHKIDERVLMQSTGLKDKNDIEIFEGDVVSFEDASDNENVFVNQGVVEIHQLGWHFSNRVSVDMEDLLDGHALDCEVIGNIHENPELLEAKDV